MFFYKELAKILIEITISVYLITFGYKVWDNFDTTGLDTARYYTEQVEIIN